VLPPFSETQVVTISLVVLLCGLGVGFILGSLWMEQRFRRKASVDERNVQSAEGERFQRDRRRDQDDGEGNVRISA
jgi:hypothetical protein